MPGERGEVADALRRTRLANERTYLAWWRTGLTTFAVSFGAGRLVPAVTHGPNWPYVVIGLAFAAVGVCLVGYGYLRHHEIELALARGEYASLTDRAARLFAAAGVLLGLGTILLLVIHPS